MDSLLDRLALGGLMGREGVVMWALALTVGIPLLVIVTGEGIERLRKRDSVYEGAFRALRNVFLPALAAALVVTQVLHWQDDTTPLWHATLVRVVLTVFWLVFAYTALVFVSAFTARAKTRDADGGLAWEGQLPAITRTIARVLAVLLPFAVLASTVWELDLTRFLTALGVGSIAIAFALQSTFSSVISGILLALDKPFKEGDWIEIDGYVGEVIEINWRTTQLMVDGRDVVIVPNTTLLDATLRNFTRIDIGSRDVISFGFAYRNMPNLVKDVALQVARECPWVADHPPTEVHTVEYGDSSVNYEMHFHVDRYVSAFHARRIREDLMTRLFYAAARHDLEIPFPIRTLRETHTGDMTDSERMRIGLDALKGSPATAAAGGDVLTRLAAAARLEDYGRGSPLSEPGQHENGIAVILRGRVAVQSSDGQDLMTLGEGQITGVRQVVGRRPNRLRTVALTDVEVVRFGQDALDAALGADAGLARSLHAYADRVLEALDAKAGNGADTTPDTTVQGRELP